MNIYDARCNNCNDTFEYRAKPGATAPCCSSCGSLDTKRIWKSVPILDKAKDPYDLLDGHIPQSTPIKSFATDHRKGGKDTT